MKINNKITEIHDGHLHQNEEERQVQKDERKKETQIEQLKREMKKEIVIKKTTDGRKKEIIEGLLLCVFD